MSKPYLLLALIPFLANCSAIAAVASSLLGQCEDFSSDELNVDLNEECRGLQDFLEDNQDNLPSLTGVLSVRESGSQTDASLLITDSSGNPIDDLTTVQVAAEASADGSNFQSVTISSVDQYEDLANSEADTDHFSFVTIMDYSASILSSDLDDVYDGLGDLFENLAPIYRGEIVKFSTDVEVTQSFTDSASALQAAVNTTELEQEYTSLYDGLHQGLSDLAAETTSFRFAVLFTDGVDNDSEHTSTEVETLFEDNDIPVCVIGVGFADVGELRDIAEDSGCFFIYKTLFTDLTDAFGMVVDQVESVYRVRFNTADLQGFSTLRLTITTSDGARTVTRDL